MPKFLSQAGRAVALIAILICSLALSGCDLVVMSPSGDIAVQQKNLIIVSTVLMLLIIVPVMVLTVLFAWHYRKSNTSAAYDPDWHHSTKLEVIIWSAPLAIIIALGAITWITTHTLDPYRPLDRIDASRPIPAEVRPLTVEVVALDWKWLFFYPEQGIATVNEMAAPVDVPINFKITSTSVMNSFYIPALAGMIYAMPGMETKLHAVINKPGDFEGISSNYSGDGFSHMRFRFHGFEGDGFEQWVAQVKRNGTALNRDTFLKLEKPSVKEPVRYYSNFENGLFQAIVNMCARPGQMCADEMMHIDRMGGAGIDSHENRARLEYDSRHAGEAGQHGAGHAEGETDGAPAGAAAPGATFPATGNPARSPEPAEGIETPEGEASPQEGGTESVPQNDPDGPAPAQLNLNGGNAP